MGKIQCIAEVICTKELQRDIFSLWLRAPEIAGQAMPGQFVSLYCQDSDRLLPRPISLCEIDREDGILRLVYRVVGTGTAEFSHLETGDKIRILGPLGNGFPLRTEDCQEDNKERRSIVVGGGIGIPPLLQLSKELENEVTVVVGYRNKDTFLLDEFQEVADRVYVATEDGSLGTKGNVVDAIRENDIRGDILYCCGPLPMLRGLKDWGLENETPVWVSMEERMACGIGACLACVCGSAKEDSHTKVHNKRVCKDGPVFLSTEIQW